MRIAYLTPQYAPAIGGVERHVEEIARRVAAAGHRVEVLTQTTDRALPRRELRDGVEVRRFAAVNGSATYGVPATLFRAFARDAAGYDLVHAHGYHALPALAALAGRPRSVVFTPHYHGDGHTAFARLLHRGYRPLGDRLFRRAGAVVCVSASERRLVERDFPHAAPRVAVIPNGVDLAWAAGASPLDEPGRVVLSVGRLAAYKRVGLLVDALAHLPADVRLVVVGDGPERTALEAHVAAAGLGARVRLVGRASDEELRRWLATAALVASMSLHEAFGITLVEGAAAGAAVVASAIPAHAEVAAMIPGARLVPAGAPAAGVAEAIAAALAGPRPDPAALPTWDAVAERTLGLYPAAAGAR
jgi:glycosyltransferase involved in cell wall biosynthesis